MIDADLSGVPGIGKTLTVNEVVESLKNEPNWKKNVKLISLNATKLPKPDSIYLSLFRELTGEPQTSVSKALRFLGTTILIQTRYSRRESCR